MDPARHRPAWFVLTRHWLSLAGVALVTSAGISWLFVWPLHTRSHAENPYAGIVLFLLLPMETIPWVEVRNRTTGAVRTFSVDAAEDSAKGLPTYEMQCVDCHNRPTHTFDLPGHAVDQVLVRGDVSSTLPYIKKKAVELLQANYRTSQEAATLLPDQLVNFYQQHYPAIYAQRPQDVQNAAKTILAIYNRNVFPEMKVGWGTYPNNLGHSDFPGCFRCHDGSHSTQDGKTISQDCNLCHQSLPTEAAHPEILKTLRIAQRIAQKR